MNYVVIACIGALAAILANRGIAVFNDGFRPIVPQFYDGSISRKELATMSFAISFGLVIGFGIPSSIGASIILIHSILLSTDIIGTTCPNNKIGLVLSGVIGALYGVLLLYGLQYIVDVFAKLPFNFIGPLGSVSKFVVVAFAIFPALAVAYQHGFKKGLITGIVTVLVYFLVKKFGVFQAGSLNIKLNAEGLSMLVGTVIMLVYASQVKRQDSTANTDLIHVFSDKVTRIRKNWILLAVMGGLIACATSLTMVAGDPISLALAADSSFTEAALAALARAIGFVPLVFTTAIVTGVYAPAGCTFIFAVGLLFTGNPIVALILGAMVMVVELFLIDFFAKGMDKFPGVKDMGEHIRTSMNKVLEVALLVGAVVAAEAMSAEVGLSGIGALFVIGALLLNRTSKKPLVELAVGPVACIVYGLLINLLIVLNLVSIVAKG
ncbi:hypothetical protein EII25_05275 [Erysipelotrichaceae bacterium OH741_COT-311]|nr:hypothetical protein EII25_05275 [Erysipelotrichaceae bacterium OH741_COT-311]